ncbi:MAG: DUF4339 domain-containing protein [Candidatus Anammoximicrobium sp.]|nr:DUF4339 domain-containing protein [Candidatus Anammoximicrobium sp.]
MAEAVWFFADGDVERGPVTEAQLRALIGTGNLTPESLIWKEGMDYWTPAGEIPGLFDQPGPATPPPTPAAPAAGEAKAKPGKAVKPAAAAAAAAEPKPRLAGLGFDVRRPLEIFRFAAFLGQPLLLVGLFLILLSRGCDNLGQRHMARTLAQAKLAEGEFQDEWDRQKVPIEQELNDLSKRSDPSPSDRSRRDSLTEQLRSLNEQKQAEFERLRAGEWRELNTAARDAEAAQTLGSFWREGIFWLGACLFSLALLIVGFSGTGPERWMALVMLTVIVFSLFVRRLE